LDSGLRAIVSAAAFFAALVLSLGEPVAGERDRARNADREHSPDAVAHKPRHRDGSRFSLRIGAASMDMTAGEDTPLLGGSFGDAVDVYNQGVMAYNQAHGLSAGSPGAASPVTRDDLAWRQNLVLVTPSLRSSSHGYYFKLDVPIGFGDGARTVGAGIYPLNIGIGIGPGDAFTVHAGAGVALSWAWFSGVDGSAGGLVQGRVTVGAELAGGRNSPALVLEVGYTVRALGAVVDRDRLGAMDSYDPRVAPPPPVQDLVRGGEQRGMIDVAVGVTF